MSRVPRNPRVTLGGNTRPLERARLHKRPGHPLPRTLLCATLFSDFLTGFSPARLVECCLSCLHGGCCHKTTVLCCGATKHLGQSHTYQSFFSGQLSLKGAIDHLPLAVRLLTRWFSWALSRWCYLWWAFGYRYSFTALRL